MGFVGKEKQTWRHVVLLGVGYMRGLDNNTVHRGYSANALAEGVLVHYTYQLPHTHTHTQ